MKHTRKTAMMSHLIKGGKLSIRDAYIYFGISNVSREVRRLIEKPLDIELKREKKKSKTKYGTACEWFEYTATEANKRVMKRFLKTKTA